MATKTKVLKQFESVKNDTPRKNHKARNNSKQQQKASEIMETATNDEMINAAAKVDITPEQNAPEQNETAKAENKMKKFASQKYDEMKDLLLSGLSLASLSFALTNMYGDDNGKLAYFGFCVETQNGKMNFANKVSEDIENDPTTTKITLKITKGSEVTESIVYKFVDDTPITVASIIARFKAWYAFAKRTNNYYVRPIIKQAETIKREEKAQKDLDANEDMYIKLMAEKFGKTVEEMKQFLEK